MKKHLVPVLVLLVILSAATLLAGENPFFVEWKTPFGAPPFDLIWAEHYMPAYEEAMRQQREAVEAIVNDPAEPTFENTIEALEMSGLMLTMVDNVFTTINGSNTNETIQQIAKDSAPLLSKHRDEIRFDGKLFARVKKLYDGRSSLGLTPAQRRLIEEYYKFFVRGGANLGPEEKKELGEINQELSVLGLQFNENLLNENNKYELVIENEDDLAGLPDVVRTAAAEAAAERGHQGKWVFTLHKPSLIAFLQYSDRRDLREKIFKAYTNRGNNGDELDNKEILSRMAALRVRRANLLGYKTHAHYVLEERMAKEPAKVYDLLWKLWRPALDRAKQEAVDLQQIIRDEGGGFALEPWDWWYYAEKLKMKKYALDDEALKPYFVLDDVRGGTFTLANKLWGIEFVERNDVPVYHEEVRVFEVAEADGSHVGLFFFDPHPRASKRGGAWMGELRSAHRLGGRRVTPIVTNNANVTRPAGDVPALLNLDEVETLFHEFGHAIHGLLSECTYPWFSGTNVATDFVELPSQIMENWTTEPEMLRLYAKHYRTGRTIPADLIDKMKKARHFNQGFATVEYLAASFLDMDWHTLEQPDEVDPIGFEKVSMERIGMIPEIVTRYRSYYFRHIFSSGYAAGYYSYIWSAVLDTDAFQAFKESGDIFDRETAARFRASVLATGGSVDPMELYVQFRGREPVIEPLLEKRGLM